MTEFRYQNIYSSPLPLGQSQIASLEMFSFHFTVFESFWRINSTITSSSYLSSPHYAHEASQIPQIAALVECLIQNKCHFGQKSIWKQTAADSVVFIEIIDPSDSHLTTRLESMKKLMKEYSNAIMKEAPAGSGHTLEAALDLNRELHDYFCMIFYQHWSKGNLEGVMNPRDNIVNNYTRSIVAWAYGRIARDCLQQFVERLGL